MKQALIKIHGHEHHEQVYVNPSSDSIVLLNHSLTTTQLDLDSPVNGTVYGTLLNFKGELEQLSQKLYEPPYKNPPSAPILFIKPQNTITGMNCPIPFPPDASHLQIGANLGVVFGSTASKVSEKEALKYVLGFTIVNDVSIPHESYYRPAVKQKARDGFCPVGPWILLKEDVSNPDELAIHVLINGELKQKNSTTNLIRPISKLISDISQFITFSEGDLLLVGMPENPPLAQPGDHIRIEIEGIGSLENTVVSRHDLLAKGEQG